MKKIPNKEKIVNYYKNQVEEYGFGAKGMDWKNEETQDLRFEIINKYIDFSNKPSVLDVGCGGGGYLGYCQKKEFHFTYKGIDIVPDMIDQVTNIYGDDKAQLTSIENISENFDYVIASGTYNARLDSKINDWEAYVFESIENMFKVSNEKVILNLMTPHVDYEYDRLYYPDLNRLTSFVVEKMTRNFIIDHAYDLYELTLVIYK